MGVFYSTNYCVHFVRTITHKVGASNRARDHNIVSIWSGQYAMAKHPQRKTFSAFVSTFSAMLYIHFAYLHGMMKCSVLYIFYRTPALTRWPILLFRSWLFHIVETRLNRVRTKPSTVSPCKYYIYKLELYFSGKTERDYYLLRCVYNIVIDTLFNSNRVFIVNLLGIILERHGYGNRNFNHLTIITINTSAVSQVGYVGGLLCFTLIWRQPYWLQVNGSYKEYSLFGK